MARQPIFNIPRVVLLAIVVMGAIHAARGVLPELSDDALLARFAFVPGRLTAAIDPTPVIHRLNALLVADPDAEGPAAAARFFLGNGSAQPWTVLTYALLHGSWVHFGLNAVWLLAFGAPVARRCGAGRFLLLLAASALAGAIAHLVVDPASLQPLIGASAAVSGCMGAALRFMFRAPGSVAPEQPYLAPRLSLGAMLRDRRAATFLMVWFVSNFVTGAGATPLGLSDMPIAWQAHIGGLLLGLLAFPLFDPVPRQDTGAVGAPAPGPVLPDADGPGPGT